MTLKLSEYQKFKNWWEGKELAKNLLEDKVETPPNQISETIAKTSQVFPKPTARVEKADENLERTNNQDKDLPNWVLPAGIIFGVLLLGGIIYQLFKRKAS